MIFQAKLWTVGVGFSLGLSLTGCSLMPQQEPTVSPQVSGSPGTTKAAASPAPNGSSPTISASPGSSVSPSPGASIAASPPATSAPTAAQNPVDTKNPATSRPPLTVEKLKNAEYFFLAKGPLKLVNGKAEDQATKRTFTMSDVVAYGDLNQDGVKDAVTAIKVSIPNSGDFSYLVALVNEGGNPKNTVAEFLGPSVTVKKLTIKPDKTIEVLMSQFQPGDPECCPSLEITRNYKLQADKSKSSPQPASKK